MRFVKNLIQHSLKLVGYGLVKVPSVPPDLDEGTKSLFRSVQPYTMTSMERVFALQQSIHYIVRNRIPGAVVECGVWKGGSMMAAALTLLDLGETDRHIYLFDTFSGMSEPADIDRDQVKGKLARDLLPKSVLIQAHSPLHEVQQAMDKTKYPKDRIVFVQGKVENTIPAAAIEPIALLRLDTDWFESTYHELVHLYPRLAPGGILIIDDYGHWEGARKAVDQYIAENSLPILLHRIDSAGRLVVKPFPPGISENKPG
jgi:O-methyltransferase